MKSTLRRRAAAVAITFGVVGWITGSAVGASAVYYVGNVATYGPYRGFTYEGWNHISNNSNPGNAGVHLETAQLNDTPPGYMGVRARMWNVVTGNLCAQNSDYTYNNVAAYQLEATVYKASTCRSGDAYYGQGTVRMFQSDNTYLTKTPPQSPLLILP